MKTLICLFILLINFKVISQVNLISNPGFESYNTCPNFGAEINYCNNWNNVNLVYGVYTVGTPDYFNTCSTANCCPPNTFSGQCYPHSGNAMIGTVMYDTPAPNYREYVSTKLTCSMSTSNTYTVSFWITNGLNPISPYRIKNIGAYFSNVPLTQSGYNLINVVPQVEITTLVGSTSWVQYTFTVTPTSNWQYVTFGSFRTDAQNTPTLTYSITTGNPSVYANYFWDDIAVIGPPTGTLSVTASSPNILCNGASNAMVTINTTGGSGTYNYSWLPGGYTTSTVSNLSAGTYTVSVSDKACNSSIINITIAELPPYTDNFSDNDIPNIFTPNDDGINDIYEFSGQITCQILKLSIYNRWGQLMFETDDVTKLQWDGMNKSHQKVPDGTYFYILNAKNGKVFKGTIALVR